MNKISDIRINAFIKEANAYLHHLKDTSVLTDSPECISWLAIKADSFLSQHKILVDYNFTIVALNDIRFSVSSKSVPKLFTIDLTKDVDESIMSGYKE